MRRGRVRTVLRWRHPHPAWFFLLLWAAVTIVALALYLTGSFY